jgi:hypothetical protein
VEAVISEPLSACGFPVPRENTGKFADFGLEIAKASLLFRRKFNRLPTKFPTDQGRENLLAIREPEADNSEYELLQSCCSITSLAASLPHGERPHSTNGG